MHTSVLAAPAADRSRSLRADARRVHERAVVRSAARARRNSR
jgi:hypothetical protein